MPVLPRKAKGDTLTSADWNMLVAELERLNKITGSAPITVFNGPAGLIVKLSDDPTSKWIKVSAGKPASGIYGAKRCTVKSDWIWPTGTGTPVDPADVFDVATDDDCLFFNQPELFNDPVTHWVPTDAYVFVRASREPNDLGMATFTDNYAKALRDVDYNETTHCLRKTFVTQPADDSDWENITCADDCT
jgi:hypothetical protein